MCLNWLLCFFLFCDFVGDSCGFIMVVLWPVVFAACVGWMPLGLGVYFAFPIVVLLVIIVQRV